MITQNKKFNRILLAGLFISGAVALGYACGGDDTSPGISVPGTGGSAGTAGGSATGGGGSTNAGGGGTSNTGGGGSANPDGGGGSAGQVCTAAGTYDNSKLPLAADGGLPAL